MWEGCRVLQLAWPRAMERILVSGVTAVPDGPRQILSAADKGGGTGSMGVLKHPDLCCQAYPSCWEQVLRPLQVSHFLRGLDGWGECRICSRAGEL